MWGRTCITRKYMWDRTCIKCHMWPYVGSDLHNSLMFKDNITK